MYEVAVGTQAMTAVQAARGEAHAQVEDMRTVVQEEANFVVALSATRLEASLSVPNASPPDPSTVPIAAAPPETCWECH